MGSKADLPLKIPPLASKLIQVGVYIDCEFWGKSRVSSRKKLESLHNLIIRCQKCDLSKTRKNAVPGEGPTNATIVFIGEAPGRQEDLQGRPFVGRAGKLLDNLLENIGFQRGDVFIGNILKCRPLSASGKDRKPRVKEVSICSPYLDQQLGIIKPRMVCTLGDTATSYILTKHGVKPAKISKIHGEIFEADDLMIIPLFHPAAALYTYRLKDTMRKDFKTLANLLNQISSD